MVTQIEPKIMLTPTRERVQGWNMKKLPNL